MFKNPFLIFFILLSIEIAVLSAAAHPRTKRYFRFLPAVFWIYFLPMLISSAGWIDSKSPLYGLVTTYGLPASLFLLLLGVDLPAIARLGRTAVLMFLAGSLGIMLGTALSFLIFRPFVGDMFWMGFGALSASWTGGSANMVAVKEALGTPDDVFLPMVVVDTIVPYVWMGLLVTMSTRQAVFDRWLRADRGVIDHIRRRMAGVGPAQAVTLNARNIILLLGLAFAVFAAAAVFLALQTSAGYPALAGDIEAARKLNLSVPSQRDKALALVDDWATEENLGRFDNKLVFDAFRIKAQSFLRLRKTEEAAGLIEILRNHYPHTRALQSLPLLP